MAQNQPGAMLGMYPVDDNADSEIGWRLDKIADYVQDESTRDQAIEELRRLSLELRQ